MLAKAFIAGCTGLELSASEIDFFRNERPWGFILFSRNIESREQVVQLVVSMRECVQRPDAPVLIDEEGGRVQRLRPPHWHSNPPGRVLGKLFEKDREAGKQAAALLSRLIAHDLREIGVNVNCLPVLDVLFEGTHEAIGDRAYSTDPDIVGEIGSAIVDGLLQGGVLPIVKHMPGHGRANCDSHFDLPRVKESLEILQANDFKPFVSLNKAVMAMTAHIVFDAIDPINPATTSSRLVDRIIRGYIGFDGLLMSDDISMQALSGNYRSRTRSVFAAGLDVVLHCNGIMEEMREVASESPVLSGKSLERANDALSFLQPVKKENIMEMREEFDILIRQVQQDEK